MFRLLQNLVSARKTSKQKQQEQSKENYYRKIGADLS